MIMWFSPNGSSKTLVFSEMKMLRKFDVDDAADIATSATTVYKVHWTLYIQDSRGMRRPCHQCRQLCIQQDQRTASVSQRLLQRWKRA